MALELVHQTAYRSKSLGQSLYTPQYNVHNLDTKTLSEYVENNFTSNNVSIIASGGVEHDAFVKLVEEHFANTRQGKTQ